MKTLGTTAIVAVLATRMEALDLLQPKDQERAPRWGLSTSLGFGGAGGDFSELLQHPQTADFNIFRNSRAWRYGVGISFGSFAMKAPHQDEK